MSVTPSYYQLTPEPIALCAGMPFCLGNIVKYVCRAGAKGPEMEDLKKALHYLDLEKRRIAHAYPHGPRQAAERNEEAILLWEASDAYAGGGHREERISQRLSQFAWALANNATPEGLLR